MSGTDPEPGNTLGSAQSSLQWAEARRWFAKADEDMRIVALALDATPPLLDPAA